MFLNRVFYIVEAVLMSTHNLCLRVKKKKKKNIPLYTPFSLYKSGVQADINHTGMLS